jgi:hypothetical protein
MLSFRVAGINRLVKTGLFVVALAGIVAAACSGVPGHRPPPPTSGGPLISSRTTMVTAWEFPRNPLTDPTLDDSRLSAEIKWGFRIFTNTHGEAPQFTPGRMSCNNCHLNGGQRDRSLPLVGIVGMFPEYNRRSGRLFSLNDRIVDCFLRSQNAAGRPQRSPDVELEGSACGGCLSDVALEGISGGRQPSLARPEHHSRRQADSGGEAGSREGRRDLSRSVYDVSRPRRTGRLHR